MKIVYLLPGGLYNSGGMERVTIIKANYLVENGYDVSIVTTEQMGRPVFYPLSDKVTLYHLDIGIYENFKKESYFQKLISRFVKTKKYKSELSKLLQRIKPDITVSTLGLDIDFINDIKDGSIKIGELHFPGNFRQIMAEKLSNSFIPNYIAKIRTQKMKDECLKLSQLVVLTGEEMKSWTVNSNIKVIPNPLPVFSEKSSSLENKKAIAIGRLAFEKGFDWLIDVWEIVNKKYPDWELNIFGNGDEKDSLLDLIKIKSLENVVKINAPVSDIHNQYLQHSMILFTSRYLDALPMVLIEAMSCGLPIVSFDAPCGPKDIVKDGENGFLVKTGDIQTLADRIGLLIESEDLRKKQGYKAKEFSSNYRVEKIMEQWINLFEKFKR